MIEYSIAVPSVQKFQDIMNRFMNNLLWIWKNSFIITIRKCSEPDEKAKQVYDFLKYKYTPFVRKKPVVLKTEPIRPLLAQTKKL